jgi:hypothetical protein
LLLLAFHTGDEAFHLPELSVRPISMDFFVFQANSIRGYLEAAGLAIEEIIERGPYPPEVEHQSRRVSIFAPKPRLRGTARRACKQLVSCNAARLYKTNREQLAEDRASPLDRFSALDCK